MEKTLGIYARQSREKETTNSIDDQILQGKKQAETLGMNSLIYIDRGETAALDTFKNRPEFMKLLEDIGHGKIHAVYVYDESRLTRNQATKFSIKSIFAENGIKVYTTLDGVIDFKDTDQEFMSDIRTLFAAKFVKDSSKKIRSVLQNRADQGKAHTGILKPYGYTSDTEKNLVIDEDEKPIIEEIYRSYLEGWGSGRIAEKLNEKGVPTKGKKLLKNGITVTNKYSKVKRNITNSEITWKGNTVLNILKNPIYKGERIYKEKSIKVPSIILPEDWELVQTQMKKNKNLSGGVKHNYFLRGLCTCGRCGSNFAGRSRTNKKDHYYYCTSKLDKNKRCGIRSINIDYLENLVWHIISNSNIIVPEVLERLEKIKNPKSVKELTFEKKSIQNSIASIEREKSKVINLYKKDLISDEEADEELTKIKKSIENDNAELTRIQALLNDTNKARLLLNEYEEFQKQLLVISDAIDNETKQRLIKRYINKIVINYDDVDEVYTIEVFVKIDQESNSILELQTFYLSKKIHDIVDENSLGTYYTTGLVKDSPPNLPKPQMLR